MDFREAIEERKRQISRLQQEIITLENAEALMKGGSPKEKPKSQPDMAKAVLEEIGKPMHVSQIAAQIKAKYGENIKTNNLGVVLFRYAKRGSHFYKVEGRPNTYGLVKWQDLEERLDGLKPGHLVANVNN